MLPRIPTWIEAERAGKNLRYWLKDLKRTSPRLVVWFWRGLCGR